MAFDGKILSEVVYGQHIQLGCKNHPGKLWSTKNIAPIGARSIFYNLKMDQNMGPECDCSADALYPIGPWPEDIHG